MFISIERSFYVGSSTSFICLLLLLTNVTLLFAENYLVPSFRNSILFLCFNFALSMAIIMYHHNIIALRYSTLSTDYKTNEFKSCSSEFFKLSGIFLLIILASSISTKYIPLKLMWISDSISYLVCVLIIMRWNSNDFMKKFITIICKMFSFRHSEDVDFIEILVADVATSFSRPLMMLAKTELVTIRTIIFW